MKSLTEFEVFYRFIDNVLPPNSEEPTNLKQIQDWTQKSINELNEKKY